MALALIAMMAAALAADPAPASAPTKQVSGVTVKATPTVAPDKPQVTVVGGDFDFVAGQDVMIWPAAALARRANGKVSLRCLIDIHGIAESCKVASESPRGLGFGNAALALRTSIKVKPKTDANGQPVDGEMLLEIDFRAPGADNNFQDLMRASKDVPPEGMISNGGFMSGVHEVNAKALLNYHNPIPTRSLTMMTDPAWSQAPDFAAWAGAYPAEAGGVEGWAVAHCKVGRDGVLSQCVVAREEPIRKGFGKAAVALASQFRVAPEVMAQAPHGAPIEVDVPIRFPAAAEAKDRTIYAPKWTEAFDPVTAARYFPPQAQAKGITAGEAVVQCQVAAGGTLSGCEVERAKPDGVGFDDAALKVAQTLRMALWSGEASPVVGGIVHLPIKLEAPGPAN